MARRDVMPASEEARKLGFEAVPPSADLHARRSRWRAVAGLGVSLLDGCAAAAGYNAEYLRATRDERKPST
jgi:hypothetical protein